MKHMKQQTNCPNCGAPYEVGLNKCPYCGTIYFDLSIIDFDNNEPIFLTIKKDGYLLTQKVLPQTATFESTSESVYATGLNDTQLAYITTNTSFETNINFIAVPLDKDHKIMAEMRIAQ